MPCGRNSTRWSRPPFGDPDATSALFHPADIRKVSTRHQIDIIQAFFKIHLCLEMKNKRALKIDKGAHFRARSEKSNLSKHLVNFWRDLEDDQHWKYDELSPLQLLEKLKPDECPADKDELARAEFFWRRRPRFPSAITYVAWLIAALGLPFWLFIVPAIGVPLLILFTVLANTNIVRSVRWRRQYELSLDRLSRHRGRCAHSTPSV
jgi:hypothetical protein